VKKRPLADDPAIEEVRRIRAEVRREAGGTPEGLIRLLDERQPRVKTQRPAKPRRQKRA
jgi:hypothetical protein